jgi:hypothetical protein
MSIHYLGATHFVLDKSIIHVILVVDEERRYEMEWVMEGLMWTGEVLWLVTWNPWTDLLALGAMAWEKYEKAREEALDGAAMMAHAM